jgi:hypothetical protein
MLFSQGIAFGVEYLFNRPETPPRKRVLGIQPLSANKKNKKNREEPLGTKYREQILFIVHRHRNVVYRRQELNMETIQTAPEWRATANEIWAVLKETERIMKQNTRESAERSAALDKKFDRLGLNVGGLNRSLGELIETLVAARLWEKFPEHGFERAYRRVPIYDETNRVRTDIDILLSDTDRAMAVEVKHELDRLKDVEEHLKRMELIRTYPPAETVNKQLLGAMAGGNVAADVTGAAYEAGFYVLELTGDSVRLVPPPAGFKPRLW